MIATESSNLALSINHNQYLMSCGSAVCLKTQLLSLNQEDIMLKALTQSISCEYVEVERSRAKV